MEKAKKIVISGASGFIGGRLTQFLQAKGYDVVALTRNHFQPSASGKLLDRISGCEAVINLAGAPIMKRWSKSYKEELIRSRVEPTRTLVDALSRVAEKPSVFISASAVGYYPSQGCFDEHTARRGEGFLSEVCALWEKEALRAADTVRTVITRFGIVLDEKGGAFGPLSLPARTGVAVWFAPGSQPISWIALTDLLHAMDFLLHTPAVEGVVNLVAPQQLTNKEFCRLVAKHYNAHIPCKVPGSLLKLALGEAAVNLMEGQCVRPARLVKNGFVFRNPDLQHFLDSLKK